MRLDARGGFLIHVIGFVVGHVGYNADDGGYDGVRMSVE